MSVCVLSVLPGSSSASCIVCKKEAATNSIYCGDECITKHATESLAVILNDKLQGQAGAQSVIVFERKTGRLLAGMFPLDLLWYSVMERALCVLNKASCALYTYYFIQ